MWIIIPLEGQLPSDTADVQQRGSSDADITPYDDTAAVPFGS